MSTSSAMCAGAVPVRLRTGDDRRQDDDRPVDVAAEPLSLLLSDGACGCPAAGTAARSRYGRISENRIKVTRSFSVTSRL